MNLLSNKSSGILPPVRKISALILAAFISLNLCACSQSDNKEKKTVSIISEASQEQSVDNKNSDTAESNVSSNDTEEVKAVKADYDTAVFGKDVLTINITADKDKWEEFLKNAGSKPWIQCDIDIDGETYKDVGIKTKGNTSLQQLVNDDTTTRYSLKVNFGKYTDGQTCHGLDKLALNNIYADSTYLKESMSYDLMKYMNVPSSLCTFAEIKVNGEHFGFYLALEDVDDSYLERIYGEDNSVEAYKPEGMDMGNAQGGMPKFDGENGQRPQMPEGMNPPDNNNFPSMPEGMNPPDNNNFPSMPEGMNPPDNNKFPSMPEGMNPPDNKNGRGGMDGERNGVDLKYTDDNAESYSNIFDNSITKIDDEDKQRLIESLKKISNGEDIENCIDTDEVLRYLACNVFPVNLDSYLSSNCHNYILTENNGKLSMLPWDYNLSFGSYQGENSDNAVNYAIDTVFYGVSAEDRPIISKLLENEKYLEKYHEYLKEIAEKYVQSGIFEQKVDKLSSIIDSFVKDDTTSFDGYDAFKEGIESLKLFTTLRAKSVLGQLDGTIPSTSDEQKNSDKLIDASSLDMKKLGSMNMSDKMRR